MNCTCTKRTQGATVMCRGMIGQGWKGHFHVWDPETPIEKEAAELHIEKYNKENRAEC